MRRIAAVALGFFALIAVLGYLITKGPGSPTVPTGTVAPVEAAAPIRGPVASGRAPGAEEIARLDRLERDLRGGADPRAVVLLVGELRFLPRQRHDRLERYWSAACTSPAGECFLPVLKQYRGEVAPFVTRALAREPSGAVRVLDLAERIYGRGGVDLDGAFDANARRAVAGILSYGLGNPYDRHAVAVRAAGLRFVQRFRLREAIRALETLGSAESFLPSRRMARAVWSQLTGKKWSSRPKGKDRRGRIDGDVDLGPSG